MNIKLALSLNILWITYNCYGQGYPYIYVDTPMSFADAEQHCSDTYSSSLATVNGLIMNEETWIGLYSTDPSGWWLWKNGEECEDNPACVDFWGTVSYGVNAPKCIKESEGGYGCAYYLKNSQNVYNDLDCDTLKPFLCQGPGYNILEYDVTLNVCDVGHAGDRGSNDFYELTITTDQGTSDREQIPSDQLIRGETVEMTAPGLGRNVESLNVISTDDDSICINGASVIIDGNTYSVSTDNLWISGNCANVQLTPCTTSQVFVLSLVSSAQQAGYGISDMFKNVDDNYIDNNLISLLIINVLVSILTASSVIFMVYCLCLRRKKNKDEIEYDRVDNNNDENEQIAIKEDP